MAGPLSRELREKIISAYYRGLGTIVEIADIFSVTPRSISNYLKQHRETGDLTPKPLPGRPPILTESNLGIIKAIVLGNRDGTLQDFCDDFKRQTGIHTTIVTIHNACKKLNLNRKKRVFTQPNKKGKM
jgi:transposase